MGLYINEMPQDALEARARTIITSTLAHWRFFNLSLAAKFRMVFGFAVLLILAVALSMPWYRMEKLVEQQNGKQARAIADAFLIFEVHRKYAGLDPLQLRYYFSVEGERNYPRPTLIKLAGKPSRDPVPEDRFTQEALEHFRSDPSLPQAMKIDYDGERKVYHYLQPVRATSACLECHHQVVPGEEYRLGELVGAVSLSLPSDPTDQMLLWNRMAIIAAVALATVCAIGVFYYITHRLILAPVGQLRQASERVSKGEINTRVKIQTGDEFEELAEAFNQMLDHLEESHEQLRTINKSLDTKLGELAQVNVALHEANRVKSEFLANVSHELRTPLNSIIGFAELLQEHPALKDDAKGSRFANNIFVSARSLLILINELLDLAKIEAGRMELHAEKVCVTDLCENLFNLIKPLADKKQLQLELNLEDNIPIMTTDGGKLQQILYNLLSNAVKFTPEGGRIMFCAQAVPPEQIRISVSDTGPGIPPDKQEAIFEKFRQVDGSTERNHGGTGLGLAISRELTIMLGGTVTVASKPGEGATFSVTLPIEIPDRHPPMPLIKL
jgi:two-component system, NarL family, sensor histidine kinase BarA